MLSFNFNTLDGKRLKDILVLTFVNGGAGGGNGVAFKDQYHVRALQFAK